MTLYLAPIQGITEFTFRNAFAKHFAGIDIAVSPFVATAQDKKLKGVMAREFAPENNRLMPLIPQILGKEPQSFADLANRLHALGYGGVNWNLGCPFPVVVKKGRGAGMLLHTEAIAAFLDQALPLMQPKLSIKLRLGLHSKDEIRRLIPLLNRYPLVEIIIHPRTGEQMYTGAVDLDAFEECLAASRHPVVYNGDINSAEIFQRLAKRFGTVNRWMLGRGLVRDPFLAETVRGLPAKSKAEKLERLRAFHDDLRKGYADILSGPAHLLNKMKETWTYLADSFEGGEAVRPHILRARGMADYEKAVASLFRRT